MDIGVVREIKDKERRAALTPSGAETLLAHGHRIRVEAGTGQGAGFTDRDYQDVGARITDTRAAWECDLVLKVKEPTEAEYPYLGSRILFTYLHLAGVTPSLTKALLAAQTTAIAYETVEDEKGRLPLLAPMSAVAGNMSVEMGNYFLAASQGGKGVLLGRIVDNHYGKVLVVGDGVVGTHAARTADAMGARVLVLGRNPEHGKALKAVTSSGLRVLESTPEAVAEEIRDADLVVGAVLLRGARAPHVITRRMVASMQPGSVVVDVSIDQGGCVETSRPTTHSDPTFQVHGITHYCVTNMPGAYPRTATEALTAATLPYIVKLADGGSDALRGDAHFARGVNTCQGYITCHPVAEALQRLDRYRPFSEVSG